MTSEAFTAAGATPTVGITGIPGTPRAPKTLAKRELDRLLLAAEQDGST
jgi:hypothetical protein